MLSVSLNEAERLKKLAFRSRLIVPSMVIK